ncbi:MAG: hypothetical protein R2827_16005 [Bdellovibrionales bacterium]
MMIRRGVQALSRGCCGCGEQSIGFYKQINARSKYGRSLLVTVSSRSCAQRIDDGEGYGSTSCIHCSHPGGSVAGVLLDGSVKWTINKIKS